MEKLKICAIVGSLRKGSLNMQLAQTVKDILKDRADLEILNYTDVPLMNEDIEFPAPDPVKRARDAVKRADGVWFFAPEYNHFFSGVLKNLIDWLSRPESETSPQVLAKKPAAISGVSLGMSGTGIAQDHLVTLLSFLDMEILNVPRFTFPNAYAALDENGKLILGDAHELLITQANAFVDFINARKK